MFRLVFVMVVWGLFVFIIGLFCWFGVDVCCIGGIGGVWGFCCGVNIVFEVFEFVVKVECVVYG